MSPRKYKQIIGVILIIAGLVLVSPVLGFYIVQSTSCEVHVYDAESILPIEGAQITLIGFYDPDFSNAYTPLGLYASTTDKNGYCNFGTSLSGVKYVVGAKADNYMAGQQQVYLAPGEKGKIIFYLDPVREDVDGTWTINDVVVVSGSTGRYVGVVRLDPDTAITITFEEIAGNVVAAYVVVGDGSTKNLVYNPTSGVWSVKFALEEGVYTMDLVAEGTSKMSITVSVALAKPGSGFSIQSIVGFAVAAVGLVVLLIPPKKS